MAFTGPSGVGKTTLLSLVAGLLKPLNGTILLLGKDITKLSDEEVSALRLGPVGLMFQSFHLDDSRTTLDNILLPGYFSKHTWHELTQRARMLGARLGLDKKLDGPVSVLSGGQRQRVALARALLLSPQLLLADEPTGALDQETTEVVLDLLSDEVKSGMSILSVTHDQHVLERADEVYQLSDSGLERAPR